MFSFDQLEAFVQAAEKGSISAAARSLGKAQSAVSTAISHLEIGLGVELFDRSGKYPLLTSQGEALIKEAQNILLRCNDFQDKAYDFAGNIDAKLCLALEEIIPHLFLNEVLERFAEKFPHTELEILYGALGDIQCLVTDDRADMGLLVPYDYPAKNLASERIGYMEFCLVASRDHPLAELKKVTKKDLEPHRQLCITSRGGEREPDTVIFSNRTWMIESTFVIRDLVLRKVGFGALPKYLIMDDLSKGHLVRLPLDSEKIPLKSAIYLLWSPGRTLGKAGQWLKEEFLKIYKNT